MNEATSHSLFEVMHGFQPSTHAYRLLSLTGATPEATDRLIVITYIIRDGVHELVQLSIETNGSQAD